MHTNPLLSGMSGVLWQGLTLTLSVSEPRNHDVMAGRVHTMKFYDRILGGGAHKSSLLSGMSGVLR